MTFLELPGLRPATLSRSSSTPHRSQCRGWDAAFLTHSCRSRAHLVCVATSCSRAPQATPIFHPQHWSLSVARKFSVVIACQTSRFALRHQLSRLVWSSRHPLRTTMTVLLRPEPEREDSLPILFPSLFPTWHLLVRVCPDSIRCRLTRPGLVPGCLGPIGKGH